MVIDQLFLAQNTSIRLGDFSAEIWNQNLLDKKQGCWSL